MLPLFCASMFVAIHFHTTMAASRSGGAWNVKHTDCARVTYTDSIDVWLVASEGLSAHSFSDVPELGRSIAGSRDKHPGVGCQRQTHHIACVTSKCGRLLTSLNVPQSTAKQNKQTKMINYDCSTRNIRDLFYIIMSRNGQSINILMFTFLHRCLWHRCYHCVIISRRLFNCWKSCLARALHLARLPILPWAQLHSETLGTFLHPPLKVILVETQESPSKW